MMVGEVVGVVSTGIFLAAKLMFFWRMAAVPVRETFESTTPNLYRQLISWRT